MHAEKYRNFMYLANVHHIYSCGRQKEKYCLKEVIGGIFVVEVLLFTFAFILLLVLHFIIQVK